MKKGWSCSDEYYHKGTWYTQTFSCHLLRGRNKNKFFHYFSLLHDLLRHQNLPYKWFVRRSKDMAMFLSIFGKPVWTSCFYCLNSQSNFEMTLELFRLSIISVSCIWVESSVRCFLSAPLIENSKLYQSGITTRK